MEKVRNSVELGPILNKIAQYLAKDQSLCRYLMYSDDEPLERTEDKPDINGYDLLNKNILVVPTINAEDFTTATKICLMLTEGEVEDNIDFKDITLRILIYTPFKAWVINDSQLRPFAVISCIERLLKGKRVESLGTIKYYGFNLRSIDDNLSCYAMDFSLDVFN